MDPWIRRQRRYKVCGPSLRYPGAPCLAYSPRVPRDLEARPLDILLCLTACLPFAIYRYPCPQLACIAHLTDVQRSPLTVHCSRAARTPLVGP